MLKAILISPVMWTAMGLITIPLYLLGWILVPLAAAFEAYDWEEAKSIYGEDIIRYHFTWPFMCLWDNWEDGCLAGKQYKDFKNKFLQIVYWSCVRNPVNNLRTVPYLSCKIDPSKIGFKWLGKKPMSFFCWQFPYTVFYSEFNIINCRLRFWIGWKIQPSDKTRSTDFGYRSKGAGYTCQLKVL